MNDLTRQALPPDDYLHLLGASLCVFNSNNSFIIENILRSDHDGLYSWHGLIDLESGKLKPIVASTISKKSGNSEIADLFSDVVDMRNRIFHSFQITCEDGTQMMATKEKTTQEQFRITEDYLRKFIKKNEALSSMIHAYRGY